MMKQLLDKTFSIRQILKFGVVLVAIALPAYVTAFFWIAWENKMGGVSVKDSPYKSVIPGDCEKFADRHYGTSQNSTDNLLLQRRSIRLTHKNLDPQYGRIRCLGYAVLTGLHGDQPRLANFSDVYVDDGGLPIVSIRVKYHQTYLPNGAKVQVNK